MVSNINNVKDLILHMTSIESGKRQVDVAQATEFIGKLSDLVFKSSPKLVAQVSILTRGPGSAISGAPVFLLPDVLQVLWKHGQKRSKRAAAKKRK